ncbi:MAG: hypothetical protein J6M44_15915 [Butyrivibrio sp.]|nr:hypothetical protein [Butyrivibrio sp.]
MLEERFGKRTTYDYTVAVGEMIKEAKKMDKEFTLADHFSDKYLITLSIYTTQIKNRQSPVV